MSLLLQYTLIFASVLILVALGGCFSEHSGVINLGLEGIMIMGALGGALTMRSMADNPSRLLVILAVILVSALVGMLYSCLLAVACINFKADQTLVGTALNLLGTAGATVIVKAINTAANPDDVSSIIQYVGAKKAFTVNIGSFEFSWFMLVTAILLVASYILLYKTRFGLRYGLRRASSGGGQRGYQRLQNALGRCADLRLPRRSGRHRVHHRRRVRVAV